jgi:hypothetical protein
MSPRILSLFPFKPSHMVKWRKAPLVWFSSLIQSCRVVGVRGDPRGVFVGVFAAAAANVSAMGRRLGVGVGDGREPRAVSFSRNSLGISGGTPQ